MLAMLVTAETRSKARILHFFKIKKILLNEKFSLTLEITKNSRKVFGVDEK